MLQSAQKTTGDSFFHCELVRLGPAELVAEVLEQTPPSARSSSSRAGREMSSDQPTVAGYVPQQLMAEPKGLQLVGHDLEGHQCHRGQLDEAQAYCRMWARRQYENFTVVSILLPKRLRQDFFNVYAFCRWSDNLADEVASPELSLKLLDWWGEQLRLCPQGKSMHPVMIALQDTLARHQLSTELFSDLLVAFKQDQVCFRYENEAALLGYCRYSANPVGRILLGLSGVHSAETDALSDDVCTGLQLANFCQDIARDAELGRIYAPLSMWQRHQVTEAMFLEGQVRPQLQELLREWVESTRPFFQRGHELVQHVPPWLATDVDLFVRGGVAVLDAIERSKFDVWTRRPTISKLRKLQLLLCALAPLPAWRRLPSRAQKEAQERNDADHRSSGAVPLRRSRARHG